MGMSIVLFIFWFFALLTYGSFNKITKLKNGDKIDVSDELGLITSYTVTRVEDFKLTSLGRGGVPKNNKDSKRLVDVLNSKDSVILQTCT